MRTANLAHRLLLHAAALLLIPLVPFVGCSIAHATDPVPANRHYNVLLISIDSLRRDLLGCYGSRLPHAPGLSPTPQLDRLASAGVRFTDAYAPSSWTLPSHMSL